MSLGQPNSVFIPKAFTLQSCGPWFLFSMSRRPRQSGSSPMRQYSGQKTEHIVSRVPWDTALDWQKYTKASRFERCRPILLWKQTKMMVAFLKMYGSWIKCHNTNLSSLKSLKSVSARLEGEGGRQYSGNKSYCKRKKQWNLKQMYYLVPSTEHYQE